MKTKSKLTIQFVSSLILGSLLIWLLGKSTGFAEIDLNIPQAILVMFTWIVCVLGFMYLFDNIPLLFKKK